MRNLDWNEGAPDELVPGMIVDDVDDGLIVIGHCGPKGFAFGGPVYDDPIVKRWAWLIQPYQLEWIESMAKQHRKGKI